MIYLITYVWKSTDGNHTGMAYMCDLLQQKYEGKFEVLKYYQRNAVKFCSIQRVNRFLSKLVERYEDLKIVLFLVFLLIRIKPTDKIILTEYLHPRINQQCLAKIIKKFCPATKVYGIAHLTPTMLNILGINNINIKEWDDNIDYFVTLGSNLSMHLQGLGVATNKIITTRHYVDMQYYNNVVKTSRTFRVIVIGNMQRNYAQLETIVKYCPNTEFIICSGRRNLSQFKKFSNVDLQGYLSESELIKLIAKSSVSLSVMEDTVGSNVIVTTMAMGLCQVVSDVGAIRDYCSGENAYFCSTTEDFIESINYLSCHSDVLLEKCRKSQDYARKYDINRFVNDLVLFKE